jgi:hypothetical protein
MNTVELKKVDIKDWLVTACGEPVTIPLNAPEGSTITISKMPVSGTITFLDANTILFTPDKTKCGQKGSGGNDGFSFKWVDPKGNSGEKVTVVSQRVQGDIPKIIQSGIVMPKAKTAQVSSKTKKSEYLCKNGSSTKPWNSKSQTCPAGYKKVKG